MPTVSSYSEPSYDVCWCPCPTPVPTSAPTEEPSLLPTTRLPSPHPTAAPSTSKPSPTPSEGPTNHPTNMPTNHPTRRPTAAPTSMPTSIPTVSPSIQPTVEPTIDFCTWTDDFDSFDTDIWSTQCDGCTYAGGDLRISGDNMLQVTNKACSEISQIYGTFTKDASCSDHFVMLSTSASTPWSWDATAGAVKFVWDCNHKYIFGQSSTTSTYCNTRTTYNIAIAVSSTSVSFYDETCGTLTLDDTIGASSLYIYVGAE